MGLDSYLYAEKYVTNYKHSLCQDRDTYNKIAAAIDMNDFGTTCFGGNSATVRITIAYWRKANHIHKFFVDLSGEEDKCQDIEVSREDLQRLLSLCEQVLELKEKSGVETVHHENIKVLKELCKTLEQKLASGSTNNDRLENLKAEIEGQIQDMETSLGERYDLSHACSKILPTTSGFFFGGTDYNEYYFEETRRTAEILQTILNRPAFSGEDYSWSFVYRASW